jgi:hypothetical protein
MSSKKTRDDVNGKDRSSNILLAIAAVLVLGLIAYVSLQSTGQQESNSNSPSAVRQATVFPTLDPAMFTGRTRDAYQAAKDVPEVLSEVDCYCGCMENSGHQNNLFCFMDQHGVG